MYQEHWKVDTKKLPSANAVGDEETHDGEDLSHLTYSQDDWMRLTSDFYLVNKFKTHPHSFRW